MRIYVLTVLLTALLLPTAEIQAAEPGWSGEIFASAQRRLQIESTNILHRPYRPLHFYGNTVRRMYYRGNPLPTIRDAVNTSQAMRR